MPTRVLYLSYDGALDPLGRSQVVPYLERLGRLGYDVTLLSFEKAEALASASEVQAMEALLRGAGVRWHRLRYHKRPTVLATAYDVAAGVGAALWILRGRDRWILHARSYVAALMGWLIKRVRGSLLVFDMRGFWVDERVDGGLWSRQSRLYRTAKRLERRFFKDSDALVSLTEAGLRSITRMEPPAISDRLLTAIIPTCVDLELFRVNHAANSAAERASDQVIVGYLGSLGTWYLLEEMVDLFKRLLRERPESRLHFVTNANERWLDERLRLKGLAQPQYAIDRVSRQGVPDRLAQFDVSVFFYKPGWSRQGTCPTKLGESLACGVPIIANAGVGDVDDLVRSRRVGVIVESLTDAAYADAWRRMQQLFDEGPALRQRCRQTAEECFSLELGLNRYTQLYDRLLRQRSGPAT